MDEFEEFSFEIPAYTPETMPFDRLMEYLKQIVIIIGGARDFHLIGIRKSSTTPLFLVPKRAALEAREKAAQVRRGEGTREQTRAYNKVSRMLRRDARDAGRPAVLKSPHKVILEIPVAPEEINIISGVRQATNVDGALIRIGGASEYATLQMQDIEGNILSRLTASRLLAKEMAKLIYEPIRVNGIGIWSRTNEGVWHLDKMQVQSYEVLEDESLTDVIEKLRALRVTWPDDADERLRAEREATL